MIGKSITILLSLAVFIAYTQAHVKLCSDYGGEAARRSASLEERMDDIRAEMEDEENRLDYLKAETMAEDNRLEGLRRKMRAEEQKLERMRAERMDLEVKTRAETEEDAFLIDLPKAQTKDEIARRIGATRNGAARKQYKKQEEDEEVEAQGLLRKAEQGEGLNPRRFLKDAEGQSEEGLNPRRFLKEDAEGQSEEGLNPRRFLKDGEEGEEESLAARNSFEANMANIDAMEDLIFAQLHKP